MPNVIGKEEKKQIFRKCFNVGIDKDRHKVYLEIELEKHTVISYDPQNKLTKETVDHKHVAEYIVLSISGHSQNYAGQIYDEINKENIPQLNRKLTWPKIERLLEIWKRWHLNDMKPNCIHQTAFNCNCEDFTERARIETAKCPNDYSYGSKWLLEPLPQKIIDEIETF